MESYFVQNINFTVCIAILYGCVPLGLVVPPPHIALIKMLSVPGARAAVSCGNRPPQPPAGLGQVVLLQESEADARVRWCGIRLEGAARAWLGLGLGLGLGL